MNIYYQTSINPETKEEWLMKEEGSWEDAGRPEVGHVYPLLKKMPKNKIICKDAVEAARVSASASYQTTWNSDDPAGQKLEKKAAKIVEEISLIQL